MFSGLPLRTTNTTTDEVAMPLVALSFQSSATRPSSTSRVTSVSSEKWTTSASAPLTTARLWSPEAPYDGANSVSLPSSVSWNASKTGSLAVSITENATTEMRVAVVAARTCRRAGAQGKHPGQSYCRSLDRLVHRSSLLYERA